MSGRTVWIVLFRGVGGKTQLPVGPLREKLSEAGFENVATYINSGNAVVTGGLAREKATAAIADLCRREFGFDKDIHLVSRAEWDDLIANNPFPEALAAPKFVHAAWLADEPEPAKVEALRQVAGASRDRIEIVGRVAYLSTPDGFGTSKLAEKFDKGIGVPNTARNWNTVLKLAELAGR
jgi:uncharacterized protein (DUF1697 family)